MKTKKTWALGFLISGSVIFLVSCSAIQEAAGVLSSAANVSGEAATVLQVGQKLRSTFADITEEEEYYIGRSVAALILSKYPVYNNDGLTQYINLIGNAVAVYSDRPEIYAGYHFQILDTEEVNALAAPGGMIFLTKGLLRRCQDEEMLGLILAHEIGHVSAKHGLQSIKKSRLVDAFTFLGTEALERFGPQGLTKLTTVFEGVLSDIVEQLVERGYDRKYEYEADGLAVKFAAKTGFEPDGILRFLKTMVGDSSIAAGKGWFKTHPSPEERIDNLNKEIAGLDMAPKLDAARTERFRQSISTLK